jgi:hypothetical protein
MANNISSLINSNTSKTLANVGKITSFGDQIKDDLKNKIKLPTLSQKQRLQLEIATLIKEQTKLKVDYEKNKLNLSINNKLNLEKLSRLRNPQERQKLIDEENNLFERSIQILEDNFDKELALNQQKLDLARQKLEELVTGPYANIEKERIRLERKKKRVKTKLTEDQVKAKKAAVKKVLSNAAKTLAPIVALQASRILFNIITANKKIQLLVDNANEIIEAAVTRQDIDNARVVRNSVLSIINDSERKLESLRKTIKTLNTIISILNIVLRLIILVASFPKVGGIPIAILLKIEKLQRLLDSLSVILSIIQGLLDAKLNNLNDLKSQLRNLNNILDNALINNLSDQDLRSFIDNIQNQQPSIPEYKGFRFAIKEEETLGAQQAVVVRGNIRRKYAVAIDKDGVEVLKSEFSFTLDPSDLIEQLKIIIDQQELQA